MTNQRNIVRAYKEKLNLLLEVAQNVNEDNSVEELMAEFERLLTDVLHVGKILVFTLFEGEWHCILQTNVSDERRDSIDVAKHLGGIADIEMLTMTDVEALADFDAVLPLMHRGELMSYVLVGDSEDGEGLSPTLRNLKFIQIVSNIVLVFIENKKMQNTLLQQAGLRQELALASRIQAGLIPAPDELLQTLHTHALSYYHPHYKVGGDYFDVLNLSAHSVGFCMADVSGKGMAAALLMSNFQAMLRSLFTARCDLRRLVTELNRRVCQNTQGEKFITLFLGRYNTLTGVLSYVNAGHNPALLRQGGTVTELTTGSIGLGMLDDMPPVEVGRVRLHKGDVVLTYTDGLVELEENGEMINASDKLRDIVAASADVEQTMARVREMAGDNRAKALCVDDTSVLAIELTRKPFFALH